MKHRLIIGCASLVLLAANVVLAQNTLPVGMWKTIDDKTGQDKSIVEITEQDGVLTGKVLEILTEPEGGKNKLCDKCKGERKDQPVVGMTILWGLARDGDDWKGGKILDPKNGKIYKSKLQVSDDGKELEVRGFIGLALIGRTQTWKRAE